MPFALTVAFKALSAALAPSVSSSYLSTLSLLFCHSSRSTPSTRVFGSVQDIPRPYLGTLSLSTFFSPLPLPCVTFFVLSKLLQLLSAMPKTKSPADLSPASSREGFAVKEHLQPKTEKS